MAFLETDFLPIVYKEVLVIARQETCGVVVSNRRRYTRGPKFGTRHLRNFFLFFFSMGNNGEYKVWPWKDWYHDSCFTDPIFFMFCLFCTLKFEFTETTDFEFLAKVFLLYVFLILSAPTGRRQLMVKSGSWMSSLLLLELVATLHIYANTETI